MLQHVVFNLCVGCAVLKIRHIHIFQRELHPNLFRLDPSLGKQNNGLHMCTSWEHIHSSCSQKREALFFQQRHVPGQGGRVAGDVGDFPGGTFRARTRMTSGLRPFLGGSTTTTSGVRPCSRRDRAAWPGVAAEKFSVFGRRCAGRCPGRLLQPGGLPPPHR